MSAFTIEAPAKVNLVLEVTGTDERGYHLLDTVFQWLTIADILEVEPNQQDDLTLNDEIGCGFAVEIDESNLVIKAQKALEKLTGKPLPCHFSLTKRIPAGGGLGGGSADAAATLIAINEVYQLNITTQELQKVAAQLGADVSFGLVGGTARGTHYGEKLTRLATPDSLAHYAVVLIIPKFALSTPEVYQAYDKLPSQEQSTCQGAAAKFAQGGVKTDIGNLLGNDLTLAACALQPQLAEIFQAIKRIGCLPLLCGSGSTVMALMPQLPSEELTRQKFTIACEQLKAYGKIEVTGLNSACRH